MNDVFYIKHIVINPENWTVNLLVTFAGVGLALALQESINWFHREKDTSRFLSSLHKEMEYNLFITQAIIENCDNLLQKLGEHNNPFGFSSVFTISGTALSFRKDVFETIKQSEQNLNIPLKISLKITQGYSRLADINLFISSMVTTWNSSEEEGIRTGINPIIIDQQRQDQAKIIIKGARAITIEAQTILRKLHQDIELSIKDI